MNSYNTSVTPASSKQTAVPKILSVISLTISGISLLSAIALLILTNTKVSGGETIGFQMTGYIAAMGIFMIGSLVLAFIGGIAGFILTIVTLVTKRVSIVWMPIVSMTASVASVIITMAVM